MNALTTLMAPVGPVAEAFIADEHSVAGLMGPYGSAKTTSCIRKIIRIALMQHKQADGVRRSRGCVVRDTYQQLETNVLNSWFTWFPKDMEGSEWNGRKMMHKVRFHVTVMEGEPPETIEIEVYFRAMGDQKAEQVLKGLELTWLWLNEADTLDKAVLSYGLPRCGRYPSAKDGGCAWYGVFCDFNAPDIDNWTYELLVEKKLPIDDKVVAKLKEKIGERFGVEFYRQPGGRSVDPLPENIMNLEPGYYETLMIGLTDNEIRRFVDNEFGIVLEGQPVYPEFNPKVHMSNEVLDALPGVPIIAGCDGGRTPAMVLAQFDEQKGQLRILREVVLWDPMKSTQLLRLGMDAFAEIAAEIVASDFPDHEVQVIFYDPSMDFGSDEDLADDVADLKEHFGGARLSPGGEPDNRIDPRLKAVRKRLTALPGGVPAILISSCCKVIRKAFSGGYIFERIGKAITQRFRNVPLKNDYSHVMDALAELCLGVQNRARLLRSAAQSRAERAAQRKQSGVQYGRGYFRP